MGGRSLPWGGLTLAGASALTGLLVASSAAAAPTYLECQLGAESGITATSAPYQWEITLDERRGSVEWALPQANGQQQGVFTAREVRWSRDGDGVRTIFAINRSTLTFTRTSLVAGQTLITTGRCRAVRTPQRAF